MTNRCRLVLAGILVIYLAPAANARAGPRQTGSRPVRVEIKALPPFVIQTNGEFQGFSIDLLDQIARRAGFNYVLQPTDTVEDLLNAVAHGQADLAIAGISITSTREQSVDFSYPMYTAGLQVMVGSGTSGSTKNAVTVVARLLPVLGFVVLLLLLVAHVIWLVESRENPEHFPRRYVEGIAEGLWWASVTMTTVGYGDRTPRGRWGRLLGVVWMFVAILIIANVTASIAAAFTVQDLRSSINGLSDLNDKRVATVQGTTAANFLANRNVQEFEVGTIDRAYALLKQQKVDAVVFDAPVLQYYATRGGAGQVGVVGSVFDPQDYGIAMPLGSQLRKPIDEQILRIQEDGTYERIRASWFGPPS